MNEDLVVQDERIDFLGRKVKGITGSTLKIIAIVTMLIDHIGAALIEPELIKIGEQCGYGMELYNSTLYKVDRIMRAIGRLGFPIFCFLLVEGFIHTRSRLKYVIRLGVFSIISEFAFDLAFNGAVLEFESQNVFVTLFLGMCMLMVMDKLLNSEKIKKIPKTILCVVIVAVFMSLALAAHSDYDRWGILAIAVMYLFRNYKNVEMYSGVMVLTLAMLNEAYAFLAMIPVALYNGKRGLKLKYVFYLFYPGHLLLLVGIGKLFHLL